MSQPDLFYRFGVALALGLLVGLQREYSHAQRPGEMTAGVRTFTLFGLVGCLAAFAAEQLGSPWVFLAVLLAPVAYIAISYAVAAWRGDVGLTTEVAALITLMAGALAYWGYTTLAVAVVVATLVVLSLKLEMEHFARDLSRQDINAALRFAVISALILPLLPNQGFGPPPFNVLNPYKIWLMVVFISAIGFIGYVLMKVVGTQRGLALTGLLGGLVSSTAVTLSFAGRSRLEPAMARAFSLAILVAWTVMYGRVLVEVAVLNSALLAQVWPPLFAAAAVGLLYAVYLFRRQSSSVSNDMELTNPFELGSALKFGLLYALVLLVSQTALMYLGAVGLYASSLLAGLTDVDAITLSMAELSARPDGLAVATAGNAILLAVLSNTLVKAGLVITTADAALQRAILPGLALMLLAAAVAVAVL